LAFVLAWLLSSLGYCLAFVFAWLLSSLSFKLRVKLAMAIVLAWLLSGLGSRLRLAIGMALVLAWLSFFQQTITTILLVAQIFVSFYVVIEPLRSVQKFASQVVTP
jgi:hypothetical protein